MYIMIYDFLLIYIYTFTFLFMIIYINVYMSTTRASVHEFFFTSAHSPVDMYKHIYTTIQNMEIWIYVKCTHTNVHIVLFNIHLYSHIHMYHPRRCKTGLVGQSAGLSVPRSPIRFRQELQQSIPARTPTIQNSFERIELLAKPLDYFLPSNQSNINQSHLFPTLHADIFLFPSFY